MKLMKFSLPFMLGWAAMWIVILGYELLAIFDSNPKTPTLTATTIRYVPWWVTLPLLGWAFFHFLVRYTK